MGEIVKPLVSVIIPTYKRSKSLNRAIDSVLSQTYPNIEIIVVDDNGKGSKYQMETEKSLEKYIKTDKIKYITHDVNRNGSAARNTGFKHSRGEYINFLDDDDVFLPKKIERQVDKLSASDYSIGATYCNTRSISNRIISKKNKIIESNFSSEGNLLVEYLCQEVTFNTSTILFKRKVIEILKGFDESFIRHQDYELMTRFFQQFYISCTGTEILLVYDLSVDRGNNPCIEKFIEIEEKFISTFSDVFESTSCRKKICKHLWTNIFKQALIFRQYKYVPKLINNIHQYGRFNRADFLTIAKCVILSLLLRK